MASMMMKNIPSTVEDPEYRYKMPRLITKMEGRGNGIKTCIVNMADVARAIKRPPQYTTKWFGNELGAQSTYIDKEGEKEERFLIHGAHDPSVFQGLLDEFIEKYVCCQNCDLPEVDLTIKKGCLRGKCKACGWTDDLDNDHRLAHFIKKNPPDKSGLKLKSEGACTGKLRKKTRKDDDPFWIEAGGYSNDDFGEEKDSGEEGVARAKKKKKKEKDKEKDKEKKGRKDKKSKSKDSEDDALSEILMPKSKKEKKEKKDKKDKKSKADKDEVEKLPKGVMHDDSDFDCSSCADSHRSESEEDSQDAIVSFEDVEDDYPENSDLEVSSDVDGYHSDICEVKQGEVGFTDSVQDILSTGKEGNVEDLNINLSPADVSTGVNFAYDDNEIADAITALKLYVETKGTTMDAEEFFDELRLQQLAKVFDHKMRLYIVLEVLCGSSMDAVAVTAQKIHIGQAISNASMPMPDILWAFTTYVQANPDAAKGFTMILKTLYDEDWVDEDGITAYFSAGSIGELNAGPGYTLAQEKAAPFLKWLSTAQEEEEEEEE
mmetsp:Transcript_124933/g.221342  ORF Transcript_124933/g.221342 Transcript_124933/m.221342 type:complete len:546 (-) Transcript_124933:222-1859(-)